MLFTKQKVPPVYISLETCITYMYISQGLPQPKTERLSHKIADSCMWRFIKIPNAKNGLQHNLILSLNHCTVALLQKIGDQEKFKIHRESRRPSGTHKSKVRKCFVGSEISNTAYQRLQIHLLILKQTENAQSHQTTSASSYTSL